jgi:UDP-N-acetylmuramate dehydrogenase
VQNVGAYGQEVSSTIVDVRAINRRTLQEVHFTNPECLFGYRESRFKRSDANAFIITHVSFRLRSEGTPTVAYPELRRRIAELHTSEDPVSLALVRDTVIALRRTKGMVVDPDDPDSRSVGSFFTNPIVDSDVLGRLKNQWPDIPSFPAETKAKLSAAWLVEHAGFPKGYSLGGAAVSNKHSLALVNKGTTTDELLQLAGAIQQAVRSRFGVNIEREPVLLD